MVWLAEKVHGAALNDNKQEAEAIIRQLTELHHLLEAEQISEADFDEREAQLLDQLEEYENNDT